VRVLERAQQPLTAAADKLVLDGLSDEPAAISLEVVDLLDHFGRQGDSHSLGRSHRNASGMK
jgi:hypothetical protein